MARLFTCGFEENDLTNTMWSITGGTAPTIVTASPVPHSGTYCITTNNAAGASSVGRSLSASITTGTLFTRFYWSTTATTFATSTLICFWRNGSNTNCLEVTLLSTGAIRLKNDASGTTTDSATGLLSTNTWYRIEIDYVVASSGGSMACRVYAGDSDTPFISLSITNENTLITNVNNIVFGKGGTSSVVTFAYDDIAINDATGSFQTINPGRGKIALLKPNGDTSVQWTKSGSSPAATNFGGVSEVPGTPDDGVTYNQDSGTTNVDKLALTDTPAEIPVSGTIILADVSARVQAGASSQTMILRIWDETGASTDGPSIALANATWSFTKTSEHLVLDTTGKIKASVDSFSAGYKGNSGASAKRVTSLWVNIEWIEANYNTIAAPKLTEVAVRRATYI